MRHSGWILLALLTTPAWAQEEQAAPPPDAAQPADTQAEQLELLRQQLSALQGIQDSLNQLQVGQTAQAETATLAQSGNAEVMRALDSAKTSLFQARQALFTGGTGADALLDTALDSLDEVVEQTQEQPLLREAQMAQQARTYVLVAYEALGRKGLDEAHRALLGAENALGRPAVR